MPQEKTVYSSEINSKVFSNIKAVLSHKKASISDSYPTFFNRDAGSEGAFPSACRSFKASFTVEAAFLMPMVAIVLAIFVFCFQIFRVEIAVQNAIDQVVREVAVEEGRAEAREDALSEISGMASLLTAGVKTKELMESAGMSFSVVEGGESGVIITAVELDDDYVRLQANYRITIPFKFFGDRTFKIRQRAVARKWTGKTTDYENDDESEWVYITKNGTVYHRDRECSYLNPSVQSVAFGTVSGLRNESQAKYYPCEVCGANPGAVVYITDYGTKYHTDRNCPGLKRTIYHVRLDQVSGRGPCSRCG